MHGREHCCILGGGRAHDQPREDAGPGGKLCIGGVGSAALRAAQPEWDSAHYQQLGRMRGTVGPCSGGTMADAGPTGLCIHHDQWDARPRQLCSHSGTVCAHDQQEGARPAQPCTRSGTARPPSAGGCAARAAVHPQWDCVPAISRRVPGRTAVTHSGTVCPRAVGGSAARTAMHPQWDSVPTINRRARPEQACTQIGTACPRSVGECTARTAVHPVWVCTPSSRGGLLDSN